MSFMNLNFQLLIYKDRPTGGKPQVRVPDITESFQDLTLTNVMTSDPTIQPGETRTIATTTRPLTADTTTQLSIVRPISIQDTIRLYWTGTGANPGFATNRNLSTAADTVVSISRQGPNVARIMSVGGTPIVATPVQVGDILQFAGNTDTLTSPFGAQNLGKEYLVQNVGTNYVDVIDNGTIGLDQNIVLGSAFATVLCIFSAGPVRIGDTISIEGAGINTNNCGAYTITDISYNYVQFVNPYASAQTFTNTSNTVVCYNYLIEFLYMRTTGPITMTLNGTNQEVIGSLSKGGPGLKLSTTQAYQVAVTNNGDCPVGVLITTAGINS